MYRTRVPGESSRPTRNDVAKLANISGATVSRVFSGRTDVPISPEARAKVLKAAKELGYQPNASAKALRSGRTGLIGFWICLQYSRYRSQVVDHMRKLLIQSEYAMAITDADEDYTHDLSLSRVLRVPVDGVIAFDASESVEEFARNQDLLAPNLPFVGMGAYWSEAKSYVGVDLRFGAELAIDHFIAAGRRKIGYLAPYNSGLLNEGPRFDGYWNRMLDSGLEPFLLPVESNTIDDIYDVLADRVKAGKAPDAILCMNDDLALDAGPALERLGLKVGQDVALIGFNGTEGIDRCAVPLSTVRQPIEQMCALALQYLRLQIEDPMCPVQQTILKPTLVVRESSPPGA